jgi:hypothetical protein
MTERQHSELQHRTPHHRLSQPFGRRYDFDETQWRAWLRLNAWCAATAFVVIAIVLVAGALR